MRTLFVALLALCLAPTLAFAAYNDVTLTTDTVLSVSGETINISGSAATIDSITVNSDNFTVTVESGSTMTVTSSVSLSASANNGVSDPVTCSSGVATLVVTPVSGSANTITVTPGTSTCSSSSGGSSGSGSGNGSPAGMMISAPTTIIPFASNATSTGSSPSAGGSPQAATTPTFVFTKNLSRGMTNADVLKLQQYLNTHGFTVAKTGAGSPGHETDYFGTATFQALIKFQDAHAATILAPNGLTKGTGYFGPSTRAFVNK